MITLDLYDNPYHHEIRNYEVSLWTLQDEFITVLKWSDVEHKGTIQDPKLVISDDATENFTFTIPMYIYERGQLIENPIWYNTRNGNLMINLRKIKIIFNKLTSDEEVFELLITKITEEHEADHLFCNVECEGLAFHELGKVGYTESLSAADFELDYKNWNTLGYWTKRDGTRMESEPIQNIQYWCNARLGLEHIPLDINGNIDSRKWYYDVVMHWDSFEKGGVIEEDENNHQRVMRDSSKIYEESFVTHWEYDSSSNKLLPRGATQYSEKQRVVEVSESNLYNITQTIAENFGVFCRYIYTHDSNYHISGRKILFFNNYLHDEDILSLTYPYSSQKVSREMDSTDVVTKLYVKPVDNSSTLLGEDSIRYCKANKMQEDYIFNFDYLKETNGITDQQYEAITEYETAIHNLNEQIIPLQNKIAIYQNQEVDLEAKITTYTNSINLTQEQINKNQDFIIELLAANGDGEYISYTNRHPDTGTILQDDKDQYYINLTTRKKGIKADSLRVFRKYVSSTLTLSEEVEEFSLSYDEYNNPIRIYGIKPVNDNYFVYLTYDYEPRLYYDAIIQYFKEKMAKDTKNKSTAENELAQLNNDPENGGDIDKPKGKRIEAQEILEEKLKEKDQTIAEFNYMMGPALREGNWTPENYQDYGERHESSKIFPTVFDDSYKVIDTGDDFILCWDDKLFDTEQDIHYELGIDQEQKTYPCINLSKIDNSDFWTHPTDYSFIFNSHYYDEDADTTNIKNIRSFKIGSEALLGFITPSDINNINNTNEIYPVLILVGAKTMSDTGTTERLIGGTIGFMMDPQRGNPRLGVITVNTNDNNVQVEIDDNTVVPIIEDYWTFGETHFGADVCKAVYPRIKFSSLMLKFQDDKFYIHQNDTLLTNYEDYYILNRNIESGTYAPEFYITIKPDKFLSSSQLNNKIQVAYTLSNAGTAIYLDAIEIEKENAYPKVSYTVDPNILNRNMISTLYNKLNWLVMINDAQLKLVNTFGYISKLELDLDFPDKDQIEVKNYKSKFEDLFSSIVASTESLKANEGTLAALAGGTYTIAEAGLANTLAMNSNIMDSYLDNYFKTSVVVKEELTDLFKNVGEILIDSTAALDSIQNLTIENAAILGDFATRIAQDYNPAIFRQTIMPTTFKRGDTWVEINNNGEPLATYTALCDSSISYPGFGWNKVYNGSVAQIMGELNIDTVTGQVQLTGSDMSITGSHSVNITGPYVNIESFTFDNGDSQIDAGVFITAKRVGINETTQTASTLLSEISVQPHEISMFGSKITLLTTVTNNNVTTNVSALQLSGDDGIFLGSGKGITLFSQDSDIGESNGATIQLMPTHLLLGANAGSDATAIKITPDSFVVAAGQANAATLSNTNSTLSGVVASGNIPASLTGLKITKNFFGVVTASTNNVNAIIMNNNGLTLAHNLAGIAEAGQADLSGASTTNGSSYVRLSGEGIDISANGHLTVNASNFKLISQEHPEGQTVESVISPSTVWTKVKDYANGNNTALKLTDDEIDMTATTTTAFSKAQLQAGLINLQATDLSTNNTTSITMNKDGLQLQGRSITINGEPIWSNERIKYGDTMPPNPTDPGLSGKPWIWIAPRLESQWVYSSNATLTSYNYDNHVETNITTSIEPIVDGNTWYKYVLKFGIKHSDTASYGNNRVIRAILKNGNRSITFDSQTVYVTESYTTVTFTKEFTGSNISAYNVAFTNTILFQAGYVAGSGWDNMNLHFDVNSIVLTISTNSANSGVYPCTVYYIKPQNS